MLTSITPLGERGRGRRWGATTAWYLLGSTVGGVIIGSLSGAIAIALAQARPTLRALTIVAAAICLLAASLDARAVRVPSWRRQVDENWLRRYRGWVVGGGFGVQLGSGFATIVSSSAVYAMLLLGALTGSFWGGLSVGGTFGLFRALPLLGVRRVRSPEALGALHGRVAALAAGVRRTTVGLLVTSAIALAIVALTAGTA